MGMPEPEDPSGLWAKVKELTLDQLWPPDDESVVYLLATTLFNSATVVDNHANAIAAVAAQLPSAWPDVIGAQFITRIVATTGTYRYLAEQIRLLSNEVRLYGDQIVEAKISIIIEIAVSAPLYFALSRIPGGGRLANHVAHWVASKLTTMITGIVARGVGGLARMTIEIGKEAVDGAINSALSQLGAMALGARDRFDVGQVAYEGGVEAIGGALGEGLSAANKAARAASTKAARAATGNADLELPSLPDNMATRVTTSAARNGVTSPSASVIAEHHDNPEALYDWRTYRDAIAERGLSSALVSVPRTIATDMAIQNNIERFGPVGYEKDLMLNAGGGGGGGGDTVPATPARGDSAAAGPAGAVDPAGTGNPASETGAETGAAPADAQQQAPAVGGGSAPPAGVDGGAGTQTDVGASGGQDTSSSDSPGAVPPGGGSAGASTAADGGPSRTVAPGGETHAHQPGTPRSESPTDHGPVADDQQGTESAQETVDQQDIGSPGGESTTDTTNTDTTNTANTANTESANTDTASDTASDTTSAAPTTEQAGPSAPEAHDDGARADDQNGGIVVAPVTGTPPATHASPTPVHTTSGPQQRGTEAKPETPVADPTKETTGEPVLATEPATDESTTETTDDTETGTDHAAPAHVEMGGVLVAAAASVAPPGPAQAPGRTGPRPRHTRIARAPTPSPAVEQDGNPAPPRDRELALVGTASRIPGFTAKLFRPSLRRTTERMIEELILDAARAAGVELHKDGDEYTIGHTGPRIRVTVGHNENGNPAEFSIVDGVAVVVVSPKLIASTPFFLRATAVKRALAHEIAEVHQLLLGNDSPDVLVEGSPDGATGTSAHEHGRQAEMVVLDGDYRAAAEKPAVPRLVRRALLRHHMRLLAEELRAHPAQEHAASRRGLLEPHVRRIVDRHFPITGPAPNLALDAVPDVETDTLPPPQAGPQRIGAFKQDLTWSNGRITHIGGVPARTRLRQFAEMRTERYNSERLAGNTALSKKRAGQAVALVMNLTTGEVFESMNGRVVGAILLKYAPQIHARIQGMFRSGRHRYEDRPGEPRVYPGFDLPYRHAEVRAADAALKAAPGTRLSDLAADVSFIGATIEEAPFCPNCSGVLHDVRSNVPKTEYDPVTKRTKDGTTGWEDDAYTGAAGKMPGFEAKANRMSRGGQTIRLIERLLADDTVRQRIADAAGLAAIEPDDLGGYRGVRRDGSGFPFRIRVGETSDGNPAELTVVDGEGFIRVAPTLVSSTKVWLRSTALSRALGHEISEINQKLLGNDNADLLVGKAPGKRTETSAHDHGRQTEMRILAAEHDAATGPARALRRLALRHHMRLLAEEMHVHPTQDHSQQLKSRLAADVERIVDRHFPVGTRASWHSVLGPQGDGLQSHRSFIVTALVTKALPGIAVGATLGVALGSPVFGAAIGLSALASGLGDGMLGRWYATRAKAAAKELKTRAAEQQAYDNALLVKELLDPLLAAARGTAFADPAHAPAEPAPRHDGTPTGVPKLTHRLVRALPVVFGAAAASTMLPLSPPATPVDPAAGAVQSRFDLSRTVAAMWLTGLVLTGATPFVERWFQQRKIAGQLTRFGLVRDPLSHQETEFAEAVVNDLHMVLAWIDSIDGTRSQPMVATARPPAPPANHGDGPGLAHFGVRSSRRGLQSFLRAFFHYGGHLHERDAVLAGGLGVGRGVVAMLVGAIAERLLYGKERGLRDDRTRHELTEDQAFGQQLRHELITELLTGVLSEIHAARLQRLLGFDPTTTPVGKAQRLRLAEADPGAPGARRARITAEYTSMVAERARHDAEQARTAAAQARIAADKAGAGPGHPLHQRAEALAARADVVAEAAEEAARRAGQQAPDSATGNQGDTRPVGAARRHLLTAAANANAAAHRARITAEYTEMRAEQAHRDAAHTRLAADKAAGVAAAADAAARPRSDTPVGAAEQRLRVQAAEAAAAARTAETHAVRAERAAAVAVRRAGVAAVLASRAADAARAAAEKAGLSAADLDAHTPLGAPMLSAPPATSPGPRAVPLAPPAEEAPPTVVEQRTYLRYGAIVGTAGWAGVALMAHVINSLSVHPVVPGFLIAAFGAASVAGIGGWVARWKGRVAASRAKDERSDRKRATLQKLSRDAQGPRLDYLMNLLRREIAVEGRPGAVPVTDPAFEPTAPPSMTPTHIDAGHPWFTEYVRTMVGLERAALDQEPRPHLLFDARLRGLVRLTEDLRVLDLLAARAEETGDRRPLEQAIRDLEDTWFFYQRLMSTTKPMPKPGLPSEELAEERAKHPLELGRRPKVPGVLLSSMADALAASRATPGGRSFHHGPFEERPGYHTVQAEGGPAGIRAGNRWFTISQFATMLRFDPNWRGQDVWIADVGAGLTEEQLAELGRELGVPVRGELLHGDASPTPPVLPADTDPAITRAMAESEATPGGRAYFPAGDPRHDAAQQVPPVPGSPVRLRVHIEGAVDRVRIGDRLFTMAEFATMLRHAPDFAGRDLFIDAEGVGLTAAALAQLDSLVDGQVFSYRQSLADLLEASETTPAGRSFHAPGHADFRHLAQAMAPVVERHVVHVLGDVDHVLVGGERLTMAELATLIGHDASRQGRAVVVDAAGIGLSSLAIAELAAHLGAAGIHVESSTTAPADVLLQSRETPGGRAFYPNYWPKAHAEAQQAPRLPGFHTVHVAAGPDGIWFGVQRLTTAQFAEVLRHDPSWDRGRVRALWITDANTGLTTAQRDEIAGLLGVTVRSDNTAVADALAGSTLVGGNRVFGALVPAEQADPDVHTVHVVGDMTAVRIGDRRFTIEEFAKLVRLDLAWQGRPVRVAGPVGLTVRARQELADLLGVPVHGESPVADALTASHGVPGGRSFLPDGATVAEPGDTFHTVHVRGERGDVVIDGRPFTVAELAALIRHDPAWAGKRVMIAVDGTGPAAAELAELARELGVAVETTGPAHDGTDLFSRKPSVSNAEVLASGEHLPLTEETVREHATAADRDLTGVDVVVVTDPVELKYLDDERAAAATTLVHGVPQIRLGPASFADHDTLVATIAHEMTHVGQLLDGRGGEDRHQLENEAEASEAPAVERYHEHVGSPVHHRGDVRHPGPGRHPHDGPGRERPDPGRDGPAQREHGPGGARAGRGVPDAEAGRHRPADPADRQEGPDGADRGRGADESGVAPTLFRRIGPPPPKPGEPEVFAVRPVARSRFRVDQQARRDWHVVLQHARAAVTRVVGDVVGVKSARKVDDVGNFEVTRADKAGSTFTVRVVAEPTRDGAPAEVVVTGPGRGVIRVSERATKDILDRAVASALAQLSARLAGNANSQDLLTREHHPGHGLTRSAHDAGRETELAHLVRTRQEAGRYRLLRKHRLATEWRALVEDMGVHAEEEAGPQRRAVASPGTRHLLDRHAGPGTRRPSWVHEPSGYTPWKAFVPAFGASIIPGLGASAVIAGLSIAAGESLMVAAAVGLMNLGTAVTGTIVARWFGRREKDLVDAGHGYFGQKRAHEIAVKRAAITNPLLARMRTLGIDVTAPGPAEPPPTGPEPPKVQPYGALLVSRGLPPLVGAIAATTLLPLGLPFWNLVTHWGIAGFAGIFGPMAERYFRGRIVSREWKRFDAIGRELDRRNAKFDEQFAGHLHALMDRIDRIADVTSPRVSPVREPLGDVTVEKDAANRYGANSAPNNAGDFSRDATNAPSRMGNALLDSVSATGSAALDAVGSGLTRFGLGVVVAAFLDREFTRDEYAKIVAQVKFDFGATMLEQAAQQERALLAMLAEVESRVEAAEATALGQASQDAAPDAVVPLPPNPAHRPPGHRGIPEFRKQGILQAAALESVAVFSAAVWHQGWQTKYVVGAAALGIVASFPLRFMHRRAEQHAVDRKIFADRAKERVVEAAEAMAVRGFMQELINREVAEAERVRTAGHGPHALTPAPARPPVPPHLDSADPAYPDHIEALVAHERELLRREPRPLSKLGARLVALQRLDRLVARTRLFSRHEARTGDSGPARQARTDLAKIWQAYRKLVADGTAMPYDHEQYLTARQQVAEQLRSYLGQSTAIPGGRMFFAAGDPLLTDRLGVRQVDGVYTIDAHGVEHGPDGIALRIGAHLLTVEHLDAILDADPNYHGGPIRLLVCAAGRGEESFAQRLADRRGERVIAPTAHYGVDHNGTEFVTDVEVDANGIIRPKFPPTGEMRAFEPRKNNVAHLAPDLVEPPVYVGAGALDNDNPWRLRGGGTYEPSARERELAGHTIADMHLLRSELADNTSVTFRVTLDDGTQAVYKPILGEQHGQREHISGNLGAREVAASRVDEMFGFGLVPTTTMIDDNWAAPGPVTHPPGSLQRFVGNAREGGDPAAFPVLRQQQMAVLDYVTGNTDRHSGNYLTGPGGDLVAIDHGLTFPSGGGNPISSDFVALHLGGPLLPEVVAAVRAVRPHAMRAMLLASGLDAAAVDLTTARLVEIQKNGGIAGTAWPGKLTDDRYTTLPKGFDRDRPIADQGGAVRPGHRPAEANRDLPLHRGERGDAGAARPGLGPPRTAVLHGRREPARGEAHGASERGLGVHEGTAEAAEHELLHAPGREPGVAAALAAIEAAAVRYPGGRVFHLPGDPMPAPAAPVPPDPARYTVDLRGVGVLGLTPDHVAAILLADPGWTGQPIRLLTDGNDFAQHLANLLQVPVGTPAGTVAPRISLQGPPDLRLAPIEHVDPPRHITALSAPPGATVLRADLDDGRRGVYKAEADTSAHQVAAEVAAYRLSELVGFGLVPTTTAVEGPGEGPGSLQRFAENSTEGRQTSEYSMLETQRMAVLDYVVGNLDRNMGNYLTGPDGELIAIDHGLAFPEHAFDGIMSDFVRDHLGARLDPEVASAVAAVTTAELRTMLLGTGLSPAAVDGAVARLAEIREHGAITGEAWAGELIDSAAEVIRNDQPPPLPPVETDPVEALLYGLFDDSVPLPGGRSFLGPDDPAPEVAGEDGAFTVDVAGGSAGVRVGSYLLDADHLTWLIGADRNWDWDGGQPVRLRAAVDADFAQRLADRLGVVVYVGDREFTPGTPPLLHDHLAPPRELDRHGYWAGANGRVPDPGTISAAVNRGHILYGDADGVGGGHKHNSGIPFKTTFPPHWTNDDEIIARIEDVARNPEYPPVFNLEYETWTVYGIREGVVIQVFVTPDGTITSGFPVEGEGVHRNDENGAPQPLEGD
ncbi:WXG100-like domain-containing protein [Actinophytocola algeriensis]|uniref:Uncharacterized protein n=1 Tax=Actinophytocola algeriensis TaxID=1768010 RepID=A0A7W7Q3X2_9PSEU|nr:EndoU domain-containing protein [Actinophytocola algeriensis]MBB4906428.1 hypothetical protein [Actinophytocola algeriensis]MBE1477909.1 hypothetical protein [Actinophytocola algeriensis]